MTSVDEMPNPAPPPYKSAMPWCKCGMYQTMPQKKNDCDDKSTQPRFHEGSLLERKPSAPFLCSNSYPVAIWDLGMIKSKQMQVTKSFPLKKKKAFKHL